ncbi:MAG: fabG 5 [Bacteroidetes bacterium]|nr:fabG 5 [Bacteroidota bacterium]
MKYALVTGGSRGIGRAICCKLSSMGYYILINYQSNENEAMATLEKVRQLGSDGELLKFNVADSAEVKQVLDQWNAGHSGEYIEVLVNNAGIRKDNLMIWMPEGDWHNVVNTGLDGFFFVTQSLLKNMLIRKYGRIINIVSLSGIKGMPGQVNYSAAKGGIIAATKALSQEVARKNVTVNAVAPGFISTDMTHDLNESELKKVVPMGRFGKAEEVADLVGFLASEQAAYITGEVISINGGL